MSSTISVGTYVAARRPTAGSLGFWVGRVFKSCGNGFYRAEIMLADNMSDLTSVSFRNGDTAKEQSVVGFKTLKQAFYYRRRKKRAHDFDRQFAE